MQHTTWTEKLQKVGLRATLPRLTILNAFSKKCNPMSAEDIHTKIRDKVDLVTVYRTLSSLEKKGFIRKVDLRKDASCYEIASLHHHHHIVCKTCGRHEKLDICDMGNIGKKALKSSKLFKTITEHSLELFGVCRSCI